MAGRESRRDREQGRRPPWLCSPPWKTAFFGGGSSRPCGLVSGGIPADVPSLPETQASDAEKRLFDLIVVKKLFTFAFQDNAAIFQNVGAVTDG